VAKALKAEGLFVLASWTKLVELDVAYELTRKEKVRFKDDIDFLRDGRDDIYDDLDAANFHVLDTLKGEVAYPFEDDQSLFDAATLFCRETFYHEDQAPGVWTRAQATFQKKFVPGFLTQSDTGVPGTSYDLGPNHFRVIVAKKK